MLSIVAFVSVVVAAALAIPPINRAVASVLPESMAIGLRAWGRLAPRFIRFLWRRSKRAALDPTNLRRIWNYGSVMSGLKIKRTPAPEFSVVK